MLDAALRKGREEGFKEGVEEGRLSVLCEVAKLLGVPQSLVDKWVSMDPPGGWQAAMEWIVQTARKRG
jgi:predicted transcriptional regulator